MLYCNYEQYLSAGGSMSEAQFGVWAPRASAKIDRLTFGRAAGALPAVSDALADACARIIDLMYAGFDAQLRAAKGLSGASTDGYSESYTAAGAAQASTDAACMQALGDALGNDSFGILYLGVC